MVEWADFKFGPVNLDTIGPAWTKQERKGMHQIEITLPREGSEERIVYDMIYKSVDIWCSASSELSKHAAALCAMKKIKNYAVFGWEGGHYEDE